MARPREFEEAAVLDAAVRCFLAYGYEATSMRELAAETGIWGASLYNAFGDKRSLYAKALDRYVEASVGERVRRCGGLAPRAALRAFFDEILHRCLADPPQAGCMLVGAALEVAPHDAELRAAVARALARISRFFAECVRAGQADGTIARRLSPEEAASHLLAVALGLRVLARVRPEPALLEGAAAAALAPLDPAEGDGGPALPQG